MPFIKHPSYRIPLVGILLFALIWIGMFFELSRTKERYVSEAELSTQSRAKVFAEYSTNIIKRIDEVILDIRGEWRGDWKTFADVVRRKQDIMSDVAFQVAVIGPDGIMLYSNLSRPETRVDLSEREHFKIHSQNPAVDQLFISKPLLGKVSGKWSIQFTRSVVRGGHFAGVLVVSVSPDLFANFASKLNLESALATMTVLRNHNEVLARYPKDNSKLGLIVPDRVFQKSGSPQAGNYTAESTVDGIKRIYGYANLPEYKFTFLIGQPLGEVMDKYWSTARLVIGAGLLVTLMGGILLARLFRYVSQLQTTRAKLSDALNKAQSANVAKSRFLANMSHEFRTPLHGVQGAIDLLQTTSLSQEQEGLVRTAQTSAGLLLSVIDDVLDYSKLESGKFELESSEFEVRRAIEDVVCMLAPKAHGKRIDIAASVNAGVPEYALGDAVRLRQVLANLVGNAIKFTHVGQILVAVRLEGKDESRKIRVEVHDTGIGVDPEKLGTLFTPFTQADSSTSRQYGGSGLGLSICKQLVQLAGGEIGVESSLDHGSTFWFTWGLKAAQNEHISAKQVTVTNVTHVLLLGHPSAHLKIVGNMLTQWGLNHGVCHSDSQAWEWLESARLERNPCKLILLDLGFDLEYHSALVQRVRATEGMEHLPVIALSAHPLGQTPLSALSVSWLPKPVRQSDLLDTIINLTHEVDTLFPHLIDSGAIPGGQTEPAVSRVLLVEDNEITRKLGMEMLKKAGVHVDVAVNGAEAVDLYKRGAYTHVLMDIQMPIMDGLQAARQIRAWEQAKSLPAAAIIAVTAHAQLTDKMDSLAAGMNDHVTKPYTQSTLLKAMEKHMPAYPAGIAKQNKNAQGTVSRELDESRLAEIKGLMGDAYAGLILQVHNNLQTTVAGVVDAVGRQDWVSASELAHRIKNNAGDVGANRLREVASQLERQFRENINDSRTLEQLKADAAKVLPELEQLHKSLSDSK